MNSQILACSILGLQFFVFGFNGFVHWIPLPVPNEKMRLALEGLEATRFVMPVTKFIQMICGLALLFQYKIFLSFLILSPVIFCILAFHLTLNFKRSYVVLLQVGLPYLILAFELRNQFIILWQL